jgi:DNA polymerase III subunit alpha
LWYWSSLYTHLHVHSHFSFLEALDSPAALVQAASDNNLPALALTDHLSLSGAIEFYLACKKAAIKPILGLEIDLSPPKRLLSQHVQVHQGPLVLLAENEAGWASLCRISSQLLTEPEKYPGGYCSIDLLEQNANGLICLTGGQRSLLHRFSSAGDKNAVSALLSTLKDCFPDQLYVEVPPITGNLVSANPPLLQIAAKLQIPLAAAHNIYYLQPEQEPLQRTVTAIRLNSPLSNLSPEVAAPSGSYWMQPKEFATHYRGLESALAGIKEITQRCSVDLALGQLHFPVLTFEKDQSAVEVLRQKAMDGALRVYGIVTPTLQTRLDHELAVIAERGYDPIFLIVDEIMSFARNSGVPTSSRGSAASSLVAHCLGITSPDPIALNLFFERFLNPARSTPPDIDTDICSRRRDTVIEHVFDKYGRDRVAMVATINRFRPRSALGDTAKAHGLSPAEVRTLTQQLPHHYYGAFRSERDVPYAQLAQQYTQPRYRAILADAAALLNRPRHLSMHPGGLVISPGPMTDRVPVQHSGSKGILITQFDLASVEEMGLVKIDLLGIRGLTVLGDVADQIYSWQRKDYQNPLEVLETIPLHDELTSELIASGRTVGCFQVESPGMRATLKDIHARSVPDIIAALALFRPGPLKGGLRDAFVRRYQGLEPVQHLHPALEPLLEETYGVILYQEQVLRIAHELAGFSLAESDLLRRAMSHFDPGKEMQTLKENFIAGAELMQGIPPEIGAHIWELMASFAGYGFPKAHAASYAVVAWRAAWCKAHYPAEFIAAVMANWGGYYSQSVYLSEARRMGLTVRPPHVNHSKREFTVAYPKGEPVLYMGLDQVRGLTLRTQSKILNKRPFNSLVDFMLRADPRPLEADHLIRVGALSGLGPIPALLDALEKGIWKSGQPSLFQDLIGKSGEDWSLEKKLDAQIELLGIGVEAHPLEIYQDKIKAANASTIQQAIERTGKTVRVAGIRQSMHRSRTSQGEMMAFLSIEDQEGMLDLVVFPDRYRQYRSILSGTMPLLIEGIVELDENHSEPYLRVERVQIL